MKQLKQFLGGMFVFGVVVLVVCGIIKLANVFFPEPSLIPEPYVTGQLNGITVGYEEDENGPIVIVRDIETEKLERFQFVGGISEEVYGKELKSVIDNRQYNVTLLIYYIDKVKEIGYEIEMVYVIDDEKDDCIE